jgi:hypothetical protein
VLDFDDGDVDVDVHLTDQLALTGSYVSHGSSLGGILILLHMASGEFVATTRTYAGGAVALSLPPAGPYIVTAVAEDGVEAAAAKVVVSALAAHARIEVRG